MSCFCSKLRMKAIEPSLSGFSIIDFYLSVAAKKSIRAYVSDDLKLIDVGRIENLCEAADLLQLSR